MGADWTAKFGATVDGYRDDEMGGLGDREMGIRPALILLPLYPEPTGLTNFSPLHGPVIDIFWSFEGPNRHGPAQRQSLACV
jgi:hypothetical protein